VLVLGSRLLLVRRGTIARRCVVGGGKGDCGRERGTQALRPGNIRACEQQQSECESKALGHTWLLRRRYAPPHLSSVLFYDAESRLGSGSLEQNSGLVRGIFAVWALGRVGASSRNIHLNAGAVDLHFQDFATRFGNRGFYPLASFGLDQQNN